MTTKKTDKEIIDSLLDKIGADYRLRVNIEGLLKHAAILRITGNEIHENQIINALHLAIALRDGCLNVGHVAAVQSGKTGTVFFLANYVLRAIGFLKPYENVLFVTSLRHTDLYDQNKMGLEKPVPDFAGDGSDRSNVIVYKLDQFFKSPDPLRIIKEANIKGIFRDEDHVGAGKHSTFADGFFKKLRKHLPRIPLLSVSATPFDILDAKAKGHDVEIVEGVRPSNYYGITEMIRDGKIQDLPPHFRAFEKRKEGGYRVNPIITDYIKHLLTFDDGLGIIRIPNSNTAFRLRKFIKDIYKEDLECLFIGSTSECDFNIKPGLDEAKRLVFSHRKRVVLIVVNALSAGKDFDGLKEKIRFGIETRCRQLANAVQGIPGRMCGYHGNRTFKLMAPLALLKRYSELEMDSSVFHTKEWQKAIFNGGVMDLSTQSSLDEKMKEREITSIEEIWQFSKEELSTRKVRDFVSAMIGEKQYHKVMEAFHPSVYVDEGKKPYRFGDKTGKTTIRLASAYKEKDNRVHKLWKTVSKASDFGSVMFKKVDYDYGILISNYPVGDGRNKVGFCGIKLIKAGTKVILPQEMEVDNSSMYIRD